MPSSQRMSFVSLICSIILTFSIDLHAQTIDSLLRVYDSETIHTFGRHYVKGNNQLSFRELKPEFTSPATKDLYRKAKSDLAFGAR